MTSDFYGEQETVERIIAKHSWDAVRQFWLGDFADHGPDLMQAGWEGAVHARSRWETFETRTSRFSTYAFLFIRSAVRKEATKISVMRAQLRAESDSGETVFDVEYHEPSQDEMLDLQTAMNELDQQDAEIAVLSLAGFRDVEIQARTGRTQSDIAKRKKRALAQLTERLADEELLALSA